MKKRWDKFIKILFTIVIFVLVTLICILGKWSDFKFPASCAGVKEQSVKIKHSQIEKLNSYMIDAPYINQKEFYPTGCEAVSTVMALNYAGINISVDEFIDNYLDMGKAPQYQNGILAGNSPWEVFLGSPYETSGWGCYSTVIENSLNKFIDTEQYTVECLSGKTLSELCKEYINNDIPVVLWATKDMQESYLTSTWSINSKEDFTWIAPEHCLLLVGYDNDYYYFNDPLKAEKTRYLKNKVETAYEDLYSQAVVIYNRDILM